MDADYVVGKMIGGKLVMCRFYMTWRDMIKRCYSEKFQVKHPTYIGCSVCEEWLTFSNFKKWMEANPWEGKEIDKDIIKCGNKIYCPQFCAFVDSVTNSFITENGASRGSLKIGVRIRNGKYIAECRNPFTKKKETLGSFLSEDQAYAAWIKRKKELAIGLSLNQSDKRVSEALKVRY